MNFRLYMLQYRIHNWIEKRQRTIAWLLPKGIVKWCFYSVLAHATSGRWSNQLVPGMSWEIAAQRWGLDDGTTPFGNRVD